MEVEKSFGGIFMQEKIDVKKIFDHKISNEELIIGYFMAYQQETDEQKRLYLLKKIEDLRKKGEA